MTDPGRELLSKIEEAILDEGTSTTSILNMCIVLGGRSDSTRLRDWASRELKGYTSRDGLPDYRTVHAAILLDAFVGNGKITGQQVGAEQLPEFVRAEGIGNELPLLQPLAQLEAMATRDKPTQLVLPGATIIMEAIDKASGSPFQHCTALYWSLAPEVIRGVVGQVRTAVAELVGELLAALPAGEAPTRDATDQAVSYALGNIGNRAHVTINTGQARDGATAQVATLPDSAAQPESWWTRWRKRGLVIGAATVVAAVAGVATWLGWNPFV
ncbi:hypothetical protein [Pseudonocardia sp. WMMC193]|uniref:AbiTii domain-containing protein n=1 Tax=Pseudonocardia sp. WMMC193 TaxID=2911965 RepID=UPI001F3004EA|nr:hypothetical protein [Pseudonocardia sp. WMMC193]MCF7553758.1 hypothetical protein [Pseudonocardia sp. WMMC193]